MEPYVPDSLPLQQLDYGRLIRLIGPANAALAICLEKARFAWVVEQSDDGYIIVDADDHIQSCNGRAGALLILRDDEQGTNRAR